jgi:hypothetical protein
LGLLRQTEEVHVLSAGKSTAIIQELDVPTYIPLPEAARKYRLSENRLTQLIRAGKIEAVQLPSGELLVSAENGQSKTREMIINEKYPHLKGVPITITEAAKKYEFAEINNRKVART